MVEIRAVITGKVQGVMFRAYVQQSATDLELVGYTKNESDGSVLVVAQGTPETLKDFIEYLHEGSSLSSVESVSVDWGDARVTYEEFSVLH